MTLPNKSLAQTEQERTTNGIAEVDQALQTLVRGFPQDGELLPQLVEFGGNFTASDRSTPQEKDLRTPAEKAQQGEQVRKNIWQAAEKVNLAAEVRKIYAETLSNPPRKPSTTPLERVRQLLALIERGKDAIMSRMLGMN